MAQEPRPGFLGFSASESHLKAAAQGLAEAAATLQALSGDASSRPTWFLTASQAIRGRTSASCYRLKATFISLPCGFLPRAAHNMCGLFIARRESLLVRQCVHEVTLFHHLCHILVVWSKLEDTVSLQQRELCKVMNSRRWRSWQPP